VVAVVAQPDRPAGRGRRTRPGAVAECARRAGLPLLQPERIGAPEAVAALAALEPDLGVVVAFGQFLPRAVRELPRLGYCINGHASLLPRWRGAAPIQRAILAGDGVTGVSVMRVEREMDAGAVARRGELAIGPDETAGELSRRLADLTAGLVAEVVDEIAAGRVRFAPQDPAGVTLAPRLERDEAHLDFSQPAEALARRVRAFAPQPGAFAQWRGEPLRILAARAEPGPAGALPGAIRVERGLPPRIATGDGWLVPTRLQRAGGKPLDTDAFLRGRPFTDGERLS
jgi:methionyl-tRNA formyltransferase